ncbi:DUF4148 domain-containing protein [Pseudorhodoferax sp. LjRoot39]|uniref:DUF4148 domain-containing protein n=1 Tax=Pseudorhodoferax sp. LjRoot39 TaxID=3342328 RepID=UPI003ECC2396
MSRLNAIIITTVAALGFASQVQAQTMTRDQVRAEYLQARDQGHLPAYGEVGDTQQMPSTRSNVTRAQVLQELAASGPVQTGEGADASVPTPIGSQRTRAEVRAEAVRAVRNGTIPGGEV